MLRTKERLDAEMRTESADVTVVPVPLSFTDFLVKIILTKLIEKNLKIYEKKRIPDRLRIFWQKSWSSGSLSHRQSLGF